MGFPKPPFFCTQRQRGRPKQKTPGSDRQTRQKKGKHHHRIGKTSSHTSPGVINSAMSITDPRGRYQTSRGPKKQQPIGCKQKPPTIAHEINKQWTPVLQSNYEGGVGHTNQHCHKSPNSTKHPEAHTTRNGTVNRRGMELPKSGHQSGRKR